MKEFILCKEDFDNIIEWCFNTIQDEENPTLQSKYLMEVSDIQSKETDNEKWTELLSSQVFKVTYGEVYEILGNKVFVND